MVGKLTQYKRVLFIGIKIKHWEAPFVMYYNAGGRHPETDLKGERVGIALSKDMKTWKRYSGNPVFADNKMELQQEMHIKKMGDVGHVMFLSLLLNLRVNIKHSIHLLPAMIW